MKKAVTFRFDAALLEDVRRCAAHENRSLTNFIETLVKTHVASRIDHSVEPSDPILAAMPSSRLP